ncbi:MAG: hypothetical protein WKF81_12090, partial [Thermomicrobiales bacterium]
MTDTMGRNSTRRGGNNRRGRKGGGSGARTVAVKRSVPVIRVPVLLPSVMSVAEFAEKIETSGIDIIR